MVNILRSSSQQYLDALEFATNLLVFFFLLYLLLVITIVMQEERAGQSDGNAADCQHIKEFENQQTCIVNTHFIIERQIQSLIIQNQETIMKSAYIIPEYRETFCNLYFQTIIVCGSRVLFGIVMHCEDETPIIRPHMKYNHPKQLFSIQFQQQMIPNKPYASRYMRKENFESLNYPVTPPNNLSPMLSSTQDYSAAKRSIQQKQIEDLQQKVDIILEHNDRLVNENTDLKRRLKDAEAVGANNTQRDRMSRYQVEDSEYAIRKIRSELQIKTRECEVMFSEIEAAKEANSKQIEGLRLIITNLTLSNDEVKLQNIKLAQNILSIRDECDADKRMAVKDAERRFQEKYSELQKEKQEEVAKEKANQLRIIEEITKRFDSQKIEWQERKNILIEKLQANHNKQINELRSEMMAQFNYQVKKLEQEADQRCKNERERAEKYIKDCLDGQNQANDTQVESLRHQIKALETSLDNRKKLIAQITSHELEKDSNDNNFDEIIQMRNRLKDNINHLLRENETLKIKTAQKYQRDLRETVHIYENKIDVLSAEVKNLTAINERLRFNYQGELQSKIKARRGWEIEAGQLRNLVRKLKVELQGIQDDFRINIDGLRDQNATFSMTLMKSMIQDRDKANFFEDENRKLRALYQKHEGEVEVEKKQAQQKIKYYESKLEHLKKLIEIQKKDVAEKEEMLESKMSEREANMRQTLRKEKEHMHGMIDYAESEKQRVEKELQSLQQTCKNYEIELKEKREDVENLRSKIKQNDAHIQRLRMELEMAGTDDREKNDLVNHWKDHYEVIILKLEDDKTNLKKTIDSLNQKIERLVYREQFMKCELKKGAKAIQRRGALDMRVIELGLDQNLIKNMGSIFLREQK